MPTPLEAFRIVAPEFAAEPDSTVNQYLTMATLYINVAGYPVDAQPYAQALKAASLMVARAKSLTGGSSGGTVIEEKEGDLTRKYSEASADTITDIYAEQLAELGAAYFGLGIMTR